jgi:GntR family transcriptional regulator
MLPLRADIKTALAAAKPEKLAATLEHEIRTGKLPLGAQLESEHALGRRFAVSRTTVRKGLEALVKKGLITTRTGIGSFVTFDGRILDDSLGWTKALAGTADAVVTKLLRLELITDGKLAALIGQRATRFIAVDRMRSLRSTGKVVSIERSRVPYRRSLRHVTSNGLTRDSLSLTLREAGLAPSFGEEWAEIECLSAADAMLAGVTEATPFLRTRRLVRGSDGRAMEYVVSLLDPAHFALHLEF